MRRRNLKNAAERINQYAALIQEPKQYLGKWSSVFGNDHPIYLEIGTGKGQFINELAMQHPENNYLGFEKYESVLVIGVEKWAKTMPSNLFFICADASELLEIFGENEIKGIFLNFSDPWPKARHAKRRLTSPLFLKRYQIILQPDGIIEQKTDNCDLYNYSLETFQLLQFPILKTSLDWHKEAINNVTTEYEDKFSNRGQPIYYLRVQNIKEVK